MAAYLYGDSTSSGLELDYIEFLKASIDLAVQLFVAENRARSLQAGIDERRRRAESDLGELRLLLGVINRALDTTLGAPDGPAMRCAAVVREGGQAATTRAAGQVKTQLAEEVASIGQQILRERQVAARALEGFLLRNDLPGARMSTDLAFDGVARYRAQQRGSSDLGLEWVMTLGIPDGSLLAQPLKLERIAPNLEVRVPDSGGGWMRKGARIKSQKLGPLYLVELNASEDQTTIKLRVTPSLDEAGFNLQVGADHAPLRMVKVAKGGEHSPPFELLDDDIPRLLELTAQLQREVASLTRLRETMVDAELDGTLLTEHETPALVARRLIARIAPIIQEIARRSLSRDELVLKRVLADDHRREEIFVAKSELEAMLEPLPSVARVEFAPLGLGGPPSEKAGSIETVEPRQGGHGFGGFTDVEPTHSKAATAQMPAAPPPPEARRTRPTASPSAPPPTERDRAPRASEPRGLIVPAPPADGEDDVTSLNATPAKKAEPVAADRADTSTEEAPAQKPPADSIDVALTELERDG